MKVFAILSFAAVAMAGALEMRAGCNGNNCNRAVTGTGGHLLPSETRKADCSSFQATTVTPDAVYVFGLRLELATLSRRRSSRTRCQREPQS